MASSSSSPLKLCIGASAGGHTNQLFSLLGQSSSWPIEPTVCVTTLDIMRSQFEPIAPTHVVGECHRKRPFAAVAVVFRALWFTLRERPDVIVTTGSLPLAIVSFWVKVFRG